MLVTMETDSRLSCCLCSLDEGTMVHLHSAEQGSESLHRARKGSLGTSSYWGRGLAHHPQQTRQTKEKRQRLQKEPGHE